MLHPIISSSPYLYGNKPHAVRQAGNLSFQYDANGNMTQRYDGGTSVTLDLAWNHDNKPSVISRRVGGGASQPYLTFTYDGKSQRVKKYNHFTGATTLYFGEVYEVRNEEPIIHLFANTRRVASIHEDGRMQYYHGNHLHSASVVTDGYGNTKETIEYHPYGTYRLRTDLDASFPNVNHTFTDQEEDDEAGLYNYKARLYDPLLGRFISADSIVPEPGNLQAYNRYSYCLNNPVVYTDPSGQFSLGDVFNAFITGVVAAVVFWATGGTGTPGITTFIAGITAGAAGGAAGGTVAGGMGAGFNGGDIGYGMLRGMGLGALGGAAFGGIDYYYRGNWTLGRVGAYGVAGGGMGELSGEGFGQGALFAGGTAFARYGYNKMVGYDVTWQAGKGYQRDILTGLKPHAS
ncbi:MAG: RHS repeat-associated core domain-containing protein [Syntrophorhabdaceae bacterium]|nr:RHS repeat-associated core domain-containing protein [Syntrophorhabdaceae bacterium]